MDINKFFGIYTDDQILGVVSKISTLLDESINGFDSIKVKDYISRLSIFRGRLITIEFQLRRNLDNKKYEALEQNIMNAKTSELREIQLDAYTVVERDNFDIIKKFREELTNKSTLASSMLKSIDINKGTRVES